MSGRFVPPLSSMGFDFYGLLIVLYILRQVAWRRSITLSLPVTDRRQYMETNEQQIQRLVEEWHRRMHKVSLTQFSAS